VDRLVGLEPQSRWRIAAGLLFASALWSALVLWQVTSLGFSTNLVDGVTVGSQWNVPWALVACALTAGASSIAATAFLRRRALGPARAAMAVAAVAGIVGLLSSVAAIVAYWVTRD